MASPAPFTGLRPLLAVAAAAAILLVQAASGSISSPLHLEPSDRHGGFAFPVHNCSGSGNGAGAATTTAATNGFAGRKVGKGDAIQRQQQYFSHESGKETETAQFAVINNDPDLSLAWIQLGPYRKRLNLLEGSRDDQRRQQKAASRAYLITEKVSLDNPVLGVLFFSFWDQRPSQLPSSANAKSQSCLVLRAQLRLNASASLQASAQCHLRDAAADGPATLCQLVLPAHWWTRERDSRRDSHRISSAWGKKKPASAKRKSLDRLAVTVALAQFPWNERQQACLTSEGAGLKEARWTELEDEAAFESGGWAGDEEEEGEEEGAEGEGQQEGGTPTGVAVTSDPLGRAESLFPVTDRVLDVFPNARLYLPIAINFSHWMEHGKKEGFTSIKLRIRSRPGSKLVEVLPNEALAATWNLSFSLNRRRSQVEVILAVKPSAAEQHGGVHVLGHILLEMDSEKSLVDESTSTGSTAKHLVWHASLLTDHSTRGPIATSDPVSAQQRTFKWFTTLNVQKDDVKAVIPVWKNDEFFNLSPLSGEQQSELMRVMMVSAAGKVADVTSQSTCSSREEAVIKVSPSCNSIYTDGSESGSGALTAEILVSYGSARGVGTLRVWVPQQPLKVQVDDAKLSVIRDWKLQEGDDCRNVYQQTRVRVFAQFIAQDSDSGRTSLFPSRLQELDISELVVKHLRVTDPNVVRRRKKFILQGLRSGFSEVQVVSPITGQVLGTTDVAVTTAEAESLASISAKVVSDVHFSLDKKAKAKASEQQGQPLMVKVLAQPSEEFSTRFQEGFLDISLLFSDGSAVSLWDIDPSTYSMQVKSLRPEVLAVVNQARPSAVDLGGGRRRLLRLLALSSGSGPMLTLALKTTSMCSQPRQTLLSATATASVKVTSKPGGMSKRSRVRGLDLNLADLPLKDQQSRDMDHFSRLGEDGGDDDEAAAKHKSSSAAHVVKVDGGIFGSLLSVKTVAYVALAAFCASLVIFSVACYVPVRRRYGHDQMGMTKTASSRANDWVWLGTMKKETEADHSDLGGFGGGPGDQAPLPQPLPPSRHSLNSLPSQQQPQFGSGVVAPRARQRPASVNIQGEPVRRRRELPQLPRRHYLQQQDPVAPTRPTNFHVGVRDGSRPPMMPPPHPPVANINYRSNPRQQPPLTVAGRPRLPTPVEEVTSPMGVVSAAPATRSPDAWMVNPATPASPLRQSPASALPPFFQMAGSHAQDDNQHQRQPRALANTTNVNATDFANGNSDSNCSTLSSNHSSCHMMLTNNAHRSLPEEEEDDDDDFNPDLSRATPPRRGALRLFDNPFDDNDDECAAVDPKQLSPNVEWAARRPVAIDSSTFVRPDKDKRRPRAPAPVEDSGSGGEDEDLEHDAAEEDEVEDVGDGAQEYEKLMQFFEALKESNA